MQGRFSGFYTPERASLHISVGFDGPHRGVAFDSATASAARVRSRISGMLDKVAGPIISFSSDTVQVWSDRPWNQSGLMMDPVFHSRIGFLVRFTDFEALATFIEDIVGVEGVTVGPLRWDLTETTRSAAIAEVRSRAVKDAVVKATIYAQSIGLGTVKAVAIADEGMLDGVRAGSSSHGAARELRMTAASDQTAPQLSLTPEELEIAAVVDARFVAS